MSTVARRPAPLLSRQSAGPSRREELLTIAARLFAARGFAGVTMDDVGAGAGISGPALYHHFQSKESMLGEMLVSISEHLLATAEAITATAAPAEQVVVQLVRAHVDFAVDHPELISVHFRDLVLASPADQRRVRRLQATYVGLWSDTLRALHPGLDADTARSTAHAVFGLLNSTPHSARSSRDETASMLERLALAAVHA
jgi:AcrR family transcriptional regulator